MYLEVKLTAGLPVTVDILYRPTEDLGVLSISLVKHSSNPHLEDTSHLYHLHHPHQHDQRGEHGARHLTVWPD